MSLNEIRLKTEYAEAYDDYGSAYNPQSNWNRNKSTKIKIG